MKSCYKVCVHSEDSSHKCGKFHFGELHGSSRLVFASSKVWALFEGHGDKASLICELLGGDISLKKSSHMMPTWRFLFTVQCLGFRV